MSSQNMVIGNERVIKQPDGGDSVDFEPCWEQFASINNVSIIIFTYASLRIPFICY